MSLHVALPISLFSANARSVSAATRVGRSSPGGTESTRRPSCSRVKPMSGRAIASRFTASTQAAYSERGERRNLRRARSEEHTYELQSLIRISYGVFFLKKKKTTTRYK